MTLFILACVGLLCLSCLFYLLPTSRGEAEEENLQDANVEWYRQRQRELAAEPVESAESLDADAQLRLLEDAEAEAASPTSQSQRFPSWAILPFVAVASFGLYYLLGAAPDVMISRQLASLDENATPDQVRELMAAVQSRSQQRPDNLDYLNMLGRHYMGQEDYQRAADTFARLAEDLPEDAYALASAAQAAYLAADRKLNTETRLLAEQALAINPHQRTALGLLGMASFEQGQYRAAMSYWQRLLATEQPGTDGARMISSVLATARQRLLEAGGEVDALPGEQAVAAVDTTPGVTVRVALPQGAVLAPTDTVFVLARNAESDSRMPIAVQRLQGNQLPLTLRLDDRNSMAGQTLSSVNSVEVVVQVSPDGMPGEANATWLGRGGPLVPSLDEIPLEITLQPRG